MDNSIHHHVFDPALDHNHALNPDPHPVQTDPPPSSATLIPDPSSAKRRPGRPKGSTKKNLLAGSPVPPKLKRPVGRPRKDGFPAGSVGPKVKRERTVATAQQVVQYPGVGYPPMPYGFSISAPIPPVAPPPPAFQIDPSLGSGDNEWADLARTNPNAFLSALLAALAAPNPVSSAGPTVEEAFKSHLVSLAPNPTQMQPIPSLYSILKTFWLPSSPAYFSLTASASTARTPSEHRFLYWDPQPLVFNGIACPSCSAPLINKGRISSGPVKIYDIERPFFIVGCEYVCRSPSCIASTSSSSSTSPTSSSTSPTSSSTSSTSSASSSAPSSAPSEGRKYASTDSSILRSLPMLLRDEFPAKLLNGDADAGCGANVWNWKAMGVSTGLWNLVMGALRCGLRKEVIMRLVWAVQQRGTVDLLGGGGAGLGGGLGLGLGGEGTGGVGSQSKSPSAAAQQVGQAQVDQNGEDDKMDEDEENEDETEGVSGEGNSNSNNQPHDQNNNNNSVVQSQSQSQSQSLSSSNAFSDAYGDAWKENTATVDTQARKVTNDSTNNTNSNTTNATNTSTTSTSTGTGTSTSTSTSTSVPQAQQQPTAHPHPHPAPPPTQQLAPSMSMANYNPYATYPPPPFAPYAYMPHLVNVNGHGLGHGHGQVMQAQAQPQPQGGPGMAMGMGVGMGVVDSHLHGHGHHPLSHPFSHPAMPMTSPPDVGVGAGPGAAGVPTGTVTGTGTAAGTGTAGTVTVTVQHTKRSPRHCCKCGSQECKGKGGRSFCTNGCQDCGKMECKGRNSRRPDKKCAEGWT